MYWTDDNANRIYQANLDGSNSSVILNTDLSCPGESEYILFFKSLVPAGRICTIFCCNFH